MLQAADSKFDLQKYAGSGVASGAGSGLGAATEQATLGASMSVKGEISGSQSFYIDGRVEGSVSFPDHRVTIGRKAVVLANIKAREVVILGMVTGDIECSERLDIRNEGVFTGQVITRRISIDEGAMVQGKVEICHSRSQEFEASERRTAAGIGTPVDLTARTVAAPASPRVEKIVGDRAAEPEGSKGAVRVEGSKVLYQEHKVGR